MTTSIENEMRASEYYVTNLSDRFVPYLSEKARKVYQTELHNTVESFDEKDGRTTLAVEQFAPEGERRIYKQFVSLCKMIWINPSEGIPELWIKRFAALYNYLVENDRIGYGQLAPVMALPLAIIEGGGQRVLLLCYTFSDYKKEDLNEWLKNDAFIEEGGIGNDNWNNLPMVELPPPQSAPLPISLPL